MSEIQSIKEAIGSITLTFGRLDDALADLIRAAFLPRADIADALFGTASLNDRLKILRKLVISGAFPDDVDPDTIMDLVDRGAKLNKQRAGYVQAVIVWEAHPTRRQLVDIRRDSSGRQTLDRIDIDQLVRFTSDLSDLRADVSELVVHIEDTSVVDLTATVEPDPSTD
jgi:hypothetical protein